MATTTKTNVYVEMMGWDEFISKLIRLQNGNFVNPSFKTYVNHVRDVVIEGTPVGDDRDEHPGLMKRSWQQPVYQINGKNSEVATVTNSVDYGVASNYGHFQQPGLYVPAIEARLVHSYVPGTYALEASLQEAELDFESIVQPQILAQWNEVRTSFYDRPGEELIDTSTDEGTE